MANDLVREHALVHELAPTLVPRGQSQMGESPPLGRGLLLRVAHGALLRSYRNHPSGGRSGHPAGSGNLHLVLAAVCGRDEASMGLRWLRWSMWLLAFGAVVLAGGLATREGRTLGGLVPIGLDVLFLSFVLAERKRRKGKS